MAAPGGPAGPPPAAAATKPSFYDPFGDPAARPAPGAPGAAAGGAPGGAGPGGEAEGFAAAGGGPSPAPPSKAKRSRLGASRRARFGLVEGRKPLPPMEAEDFLEDAIAGLGKVVDTDRRGRPVLHALWRDRGPPGAPPREPAADLLERYLADNPRNAWLAELLEQAQALGPEGAEGLLDRVQAENGRKHAEVYVKNGAEDRRGQTQVSTVDCLKDIQRFLRREADSPVRPAYLRLGRLRVAEHDLVPLLLAYQTDHEVVYNTLKVITLMTMPVDAGAATSEEQAEHLQTVKAALLARDALAVVVSLMADPLARHPRMTEEDGLTVQLIIAFIRNLLCMDDAHISLDKRRSAALREELLGRFFEDHIMEVLLFVAQHMDERPFKEEASYLLQIFDRILCANRPADLLRAAAGEEAALRQFGPKDLAGLDEAGRERALASAVVKADLRQALLKEKQAKRRGRTVKGVDGRQRILPLKPKAARHSRFGGTYVRKIDDYGEGGDVLKSRLIVRDNPNKSSYAKYNTSRPSATHKLAEDKQIARSSSATKRKLRDYIHQFLEGPYDVLMSVVRPELSAGLGISRMTPDDFYHFINVAAFCTEYTRLHPAGAGGGGGSAAGAASPFSKISATLNMQTIQIAVNVWLTQSEIPARHEDKDWDMQVDSLALVKEILYVLNASFRSSHEEDKNVADKIQRRLLYEDTKETGLLSRLTQQLKDFNPRLQPATYAGNMLEALYLVIKTYERLNSQERGGLMVRKQRRQRAPKKPAGAGADPDAGGPAGAAPDPDPAAEAEAGGAGEPATGEPPHPGVADAAAAAEAAGGLGPDTAAGAEGEEGFDEEMGYEEEPRPDTIEAAFDLVSRLRNELCLPKFVEILGFLLGTFKTNGEALNAAVCSIVTRIASKDPVKALDLGPLLWDLRFLVRLDAILSDREVHQRPEFQQLLKVATWIVRSLFERLVPELGAPPDGEEVSLELAEANKRKENAAKLLFVDLLFSKSKREAALIAQGYDFAGDGVARGARKEPVQRTLLSEEEVAILRASWEKHQGRPDLLALVAVDMAPYGGGNLSEKQLRGQLRKLNLKVPRRKSSGSGKSRILSEEEEEKLKALWAEFEAETHALDKVAAGLDNKFTNAQLSRQLKRLGLRAPRGRQGGRGAGVGDGSSSESESDSDSDSDSESEDDDIGGSAEAAAAGDGAGPRKIAGRGNGKEPSAAPATSESSSSFSDDIDDGDMEVLATQAATQRTDAGPVGPVGAVAGGQGAAPASPPPDKRAVLRHVADLKRLAFAFDAAPVFEWLKRQVDDAVAAARDGAEDLSIVPISNEEWEFIETEAVHPFLQSVGLLPPAEGSSMWRIPASRGKPHLLDVQEQLTVALRLLELHFRTRGGKGEGATGAGGPDAATDGGAGLTPRKRALGEEPTAPDAEASIPPTLEMSHTQRRKIAAIVESDDE